MPRSGHCRHGGDCNCCWMHGDERGMLGQCFRLNGERRKGGWRGIVRAAWRGDAFFGCREVEKEVAEGYNGRYGRGSLGGCVWEGRDGMV